MQPQLCIFPERRNPWPMFLVTSHQKDRGNPVTFYCLPILLCAMLCFWLTVSPASAGSYTCSISSTGAFTGNDPNGGEDREPPGPYITAPGTYNPSNDYNSMPNEVSFSGGCEAYVQAPSVSGSGALDFGFNWQPTSGNTAQTDPPPPSVILAVNGYADCWSEPNGNSSMSDTVSDGLGDTASYSSTSSQSQMQVAQRTLYVPVNTPGTSFSESYSPSTSGSISNYGEVGADIIYQINVYPITISLAQPAVQDSNGNWNILIGQKCSPQLNGIPSSLLPYTTYSWSVSGLTFQSWTVNSESGSYQAYTNESDGPGNMTLAQPSWYWRGPDAVRNISCTATISPPNQPSFTVTASISVNVQKPSAVLDIYMGSVTPLPSQTNSNYVALQQTYTNPPTGQAEGIQWVGTITTPPMFVSNGNYGQWNWTQLMTANRQEDNNGTEWVFATDATTPPTVLNGTQVLDGGYPYCQYSGDNYQGFWYPADGTSNGNSDSPGEPLDQSMTSYDVNDSFLDYLMYQPPGSSYPVPLKLADWYWAFQANQQGGDSGNWTVTNASAEWEFVNDFPSFPSWYIVATYIAPSP